MQSSGSDSVKMYVNPKEKGPHSLGRFHEWLRDDVYDKLFRDSDVVEGILVLTLAVDDGLARREGHSELCRISYKRSH